MLTVELWYMYLSHRLYGTVTPVEGQTWVTESGTEYGSFRDSTGQWVNLPLSEIQQNIEVLIIG